MRLFGQRWLFRIGNAEVKVDNAFSLGLWTQERLLVNGEEAQASGGWARFFQSYREPWLTPLGEGELEIKLKSEGRGIACIALLDGVRVEPDEILESNWTGKARSWPDESEWRGSRSGEGWVG